MVKTRSVIVMEPYLTRKRVYCFMKFTRKQEPNPCRGEGADKTFGAQGTYNIKVETAAQKKMFHGADYVFMADMWNPKHLSDSRHLWIPISWENGAPVLKK